MANPDASIVISVIVLVSIVAFFIWFLWLKNETIRQDKIKEERREKLKQERVDHGLKGETGLQLSWMKPYPNQKEWDGKTWCYQDPNTNEWYEWARFTTHGRNYDENYREAYEIHKSMCKLMPNLYTGVFLETKPPFTFH